MEEEKRRICHDLHLYDDLTEFQVLHLDASKSDLKEALNSFFIIHFSGPVREIILPFGYLTSSDRRLLVLYNSNDFKKIEIWGLEEQRRLTVISLHDNTFPPTLAFGPIPTADNDSYYLAINIFNERQSEIQIWTLTLREKELQIRLKSTLILKTGANTILFSADGNFLFYRWM